MSNPSVVINNNLIDEAYVVRARVRGTDLFGYMQRSGGLVTRLSDAELYYDKSLAIAAGNKAKRSDFDNVEPDSYEVALVKIVPDSGESF